MTCAGGGIQFTGPCGSTIQSGYPKINPTSGRHEWQIGYLVPGNRLCCFAQRIMGVWTAKYTEPVSVIPPKTADYGFFKILEPDELPSICGSAFQNDQAAMQGVYIRPTSISVSPGPNSVMRPIWDDGVKAGLPRDYEDPCFSVQDLVCAQWGEIAPSTDASAPSGWPWLDDHNKFYLYEAGCQEDPTLANLHLVKAPTVPVVVKYEQQVTRLPVDMTCLGKNDGSTTGLAVTEDIFQVPWPTHLETRRRSGIDGRTVDTKLSFCLGSPPECCDKTVGEDAKFWAPITTDNIEIIWRNVPAPNWTRINELRGKANSTAMFGYPAYGLLFLGHTTVERVNFFNQRVYDITFSFMAKTVPAEGETNEYITAGLFPSGEVMSGQVGFWGRAWCDTPIEGTDQNWQFACRPGDKLFFQGEQWIDGADNGFRDLFSMRYYTPPP